MKILKYKYNPNKKGVFKISVVKNPAVGEGDLVLMSAAQEVKGIFYSPVMIPDVKITRIDDTTKEKYQVYYDAETVEQLCYNYMKQCGIRATNLDHSETEDTKDFYPVEIWIVKDPETDKSKALGMPLQKTGTWIMGYKADTPEAIQKIKDKLLQGLSIEGHLDAEEEVNVKFNKITMSKLTDAFEAFKTVLMSAVDEEGKEKTPEELAAEEAVKKTEMADEVPPTTEPSDLEKELETAKATISELEKKLADAEAKLATYENDAVLMSAQLGEVKTAFEKYKTVKMSSQKIGDAPAVPLVLTPIEEKQAKFLKNVESKL